MKHGLGLELPALWAARRPKIFAAFLMFLLGMAIWLVPQLRFDDDINRVLLSDNANSRNYEQQIEAFGGKSSDVIIHFERSGPFTKSDYETMQNFALDLEFLDGITSTLSPFSVRFAQTAGQNAGQTVLPETLEPSLVEDRLLLYEQSKTDLRSLISKTRNTALFIATTTPDLPQDERSNLLAEIATFTESFSGTGLTVTLTGEATISQTIAENLKTDLLKLNALGSLLVLAFAMIIFRNWRATFLTILPALVAVLASLSIFALLDYPITVISNVLPLLVLILGVADGMHLVIHLRHQPADKPRKLVITLQEIAPACALSAVTTAIAFLAVAISDNAQIREFAVAGALSVLVGYFVVAITFSLLAPVLNPTPAAHSSGNSFLNGLLDSVGRLSLKKGRLVIVLAVLVTMAGTWGYSTTQSWFPYEGNLPSTSSLQSLNKQIASDFGGTYRLWSELDTIDQNSLRTEAGWQRLVALTDAIKVAAPDYPTVSMVSVATWLGTPEKMPSVEQLRDAPEELRRQLVSPSGNVARVLTFVPEPMQNSKTLKVHDKIESAALGAGADRVVGLPQIMRHEAVGIVRQLGLGLLLACGLSAVLVGLAFRNLRLAAILLTPNVLPLLLTASALHFMDNGLMTPTAVLALTIAFGIAINDSVHCINRVHFQRLQGQNIQEALLNTIQHTGRVMVFTTILLSVGLLVTQFSVFAPVQLFGKMLIITFVIALLADLIVLPALINLKWSGL